MVKAQRFFAFLVPLLLAGCALREAPPPIVTEADPADCTDPPTHADALNKHGRGTWSDERLYVHTHQPQPVRVPQGWQPVGAAEVIGRCAVFPDRQALVFIHPDHWDVRHIPVPELGITLVRYAPKTLDADTRNAIDGMAERVHRRVRQLYPLGLLPEQQHDHALLVTTGLAGDGTNVASRIFAEPGPRLTLFFRAPTDPRAYDLLTHTTTHLLNKRRPRPETQPEDPQLPVVEHLEFVASWAELALAENAAYRKRRVNYLYDMHERVASGDKGRLPRRGVLAGLHMHHQKIAVPPRTNERSGAMMEYLHYYLNPLILVATDGLLAKRGRSLTVMELLQQVHRSNQTLLQVFDLHLTPAERAQVDLWLNGERIPRVLVDAGIARYEAATYLDWTLEKGWPDHD